MNGTYVAGYDATASGRSAVSLALTLAGHTGAHVLAALVYSLEPIWSVPAAPIASGRDWLVGIEREAGQMVARVSEELGATVPTCTIGASSPARGLHELAERESAGLIVVGSTHRTAVGRVLAGSTAHRLLHGAPCPVLVAPRSDTSMPRSLRRIAVGYDGSPESREALAVAADLARRLGASVSLVAVTPLLTAPVPVAGPPPPFEAAIERAMRAALDDARAQLVADLQVETALIEGPVARALEVWCAERADLVVVGSRGYGPVRSVLAGSVAAHLVDHAPCPVLVAPRAAHSDDGQARQR